MQFSSEDKLPGVKDLHPVPGVPAVSAQVQDQNFDQEPRNSETSGGRPEAVLDLSVPNRDLGRRDLKMMGSVALK